MESKPSTIQAQQLSQALPIEWVERLLMRFTSRYGHKFSSQITSEPQRLDWLETWSKDLADLSADEIKTALDLCPSKFPSWPPTSGEFRQLARPPLDYEKLFITSANALSTGKWPNPLAYWSAQSFGSYEMRQVSWQQAKDRWIRIVDAIANTRDLPAIPEPRQALPAPGETMSPEVAEEALKLMNACLKRLIGDK